MNKNTIHRETIPHDSKDSSLKNRKNKALDVNQIHQSPDTAYFTKIKKTKNTLNTKAYHLIKKTIQAIKNIFLKITLLAPNLKAHKNMFIEFIKNITRASKKSNYPSKEKNKDDINATKSAQAENTQIKNKNTTENNVSQTQSYIDFQRIQASIEQAKKEQARQFHNTFNLDDEILTDSSESGDEDSLNVQNKQHGNIPINRIIEITQMLEITDIKNYLACCEKSKALFYDNNNLSNNIYDLASRIPALLSAEKALSRNDLNPKQIADFSDENINIISNMLKELVKSDKKFSIIPVLYGYHFNSVLFVKIKKDNQNKIIPVIIEPSAASTTFQRTMKDIQKLTDKMPDIIEKTIPAVTHIQENVPLEDGVSCGAISATFAIELTKKLNKIKDINADNIQDGIQEQLIQPLFKKEYGFPKLRAKMLSTLGLKSKLKYDKNQ